MRLFLFLALVSFNSHADTVFYLHGKIIEDQGDLAIHPKFGTYEYKNIVSRLKEFGHTVISEQRPKGTDRMAYAYTVADSIQSLIKNGTAPQDIVVIGFSKGAQIAILVSQKLANDQIRFVFQGVCGSWLSHNREVRVYGDILSQYETSDAAGSCEELFKRSNLEACEIPISTGLSHGAFYRPLDDWVLPLENWVTTNGCDIN